MGHLIPWEEAGAMSQNYLSTFLPLPSSEHDSCTVLEVPKLRQRETEKAPFPFGSHFTQTNVFKSAPLLPRLGVDEYSGS